MGKRKQQAADISFEDEEEEVSAGSVPTSINPYHVLDLPVDASADDIKKAYRRAALKCHPDKVSAEHKDAAHQRFQEVAFAYAILSDERRRKRYDTTGRTEESLNIEDDDFNWADFFRAQFANVVTEEKINEFAGSYKGSEEEKRDLLAAYEKFEGRMSKIYQTVMLSDMTEDEDRFREIIDEAIETGEVEGYDKYLEETDKQREKRIAMARKHKEREVGEAKEAEEELRSNKKGKGKKESGSGGLGDLAALIQQKQKGREQNFFDHLEEKYAPKGKKGKSSAMDEPPEEAFTANRKKGDAVEGARKKAKTKK
ncbi:hypothetical protein CERZMDRAFT_96077 [Cercospora zeae-maydis SCOH1-5]|uniref:J domain-containing protein n=1 Tax=Cercospora zeae-maydis SCOH1-5 TaxID=717836 RepID=A0A6A6FKZ7_9PEZI|nr:hypothetical protein CERZMDRAFT_96077 [Cercospora zeae-maydis SCOH1-5]